MDSEKTMGPKRMIHYILNKGQLFSPSEKPFYIFFDFLIPRMLSATSNIIPGFVSFQFTLLFDFPNLFPSLISSNRSASSKSLRSSSPSKSSWFSSLPTSYSGRRRWIPRSFAFYSVFSPTRGSCFLSSQL